MSNNFSVNLCFSLDLSDSADAYLYDFLLHLNAFNPNSCITDIIKQLIFASALSDMSFLTFDYYLDKPCFNFDLKDYEKKVNK